MNKIQLLLIVILCIALSGLLIIELTKVELPPIPTPMVSGAPIGEGNVSPELYIGWNMVSMPQTVSKDSVSITYNDESYTWNQAVYNGYIADIIVTYDGNEYTESDIFHKTRGYWMYSLVEPLWISDEPFILYCGYLDITNESTVNLTCNTIKISPELYSNTITCGHINVLDMWEFYYLGDYI